MLWGLSLGDSPSTVLLLVGSGPEQAPWVLGVAERLPATQHPGLGRDRQSRAESPGQGHPSGHPADGMLRDRGTAAQGQLLAAATPCTGENPDFEICKDKVQTCFPLNQKCPDKPA